MKLSELQQCIARLLSAGPDCEVYLPQVDMRKRLQEDRRVPPMSVKVYMDGDKPPYAVLSANDLIKHPQLIYKPELVATPEGLKTGKDEEVQNG